jgi:hypothetical protein
MSERDDILDENLNEDVSIPVPGGDKETPNSKPNDARSLSIPGGDKEAPGSASIELSAEDYNKALSSLKKSFKEGYEIMNLLERSSIHTKSIDELQTEYAESIIDNAILEAFETGPYFEKVERSDKDEVVKIVKSLRSKIASNAKEDGLHFTSPSAISRILTGIGISVAGTALGLATGGAGQVVAKAVTATGNSITTAGLNQVWTKRLWQVVGVIHIEEGNIKDKINALNNKYKDELGNYKLLYSPTSPTIVELFVNKFNWKNDKKVYFIVVDKKLPSELKEFQKIISDGLEKSDTKDKDKKALKEWVELMEKSIEDQKDEDDKEDKDKKEDKEDKK